MESVSLDSSTNKLHGVNWYDLSLAYYVDFVRTMEKSDSFSHLFESITDEDEYTTFMSGSTSMNDSQEFFTPSSTPVCRTASIFLTEIGFIVYYALSCCRE